MSAARLSAEDFAELQARIKRDRLGAEAVVRAALQQKVVALELYDPQKPKRRWLLSRDMTGWGFRVTDIDAIGPIGHRCYDGTSKDIGEIANEYRSAMSRGWLVKERKNVSAPSP